MNYTPKEMQDGVDELLAFIEDYKKCFEGKKYEEYSSDYFNLYFLNKLSENLFSANLLFKTINDTPRTYSGLCLILRTSLSDSLIFAHINTFLYDDKDLFTERVKQLFADDARHTLKYYSKEYPSFSNMNKDALRNFLNETYKDDLNSEIDAGFRYDLKQNPSFSIEQIYNQGDMMKNSQRIKNAYKLYTQYSKIEHNGRATSSIQNSIYLLPKEAIGDIICSFDIIVYTLIAIIKKLLINNEHVDLFNRFGEIEMKYFHKSSIADILKQ